jgi:hypothetical protein
MKLCDSCEVIPVLGANLESLVRDQLRLQLLFYATIRPLCTVNFGCLDMVAVQKPP